MDYQGLINQYCINNNYYDYQVDNAEKIYNLLYNNILYDSEIGVELHYLGLYYYEKDNEKYNYYMNMGCDKGFFGSMKSLGLHHQFESKNYDLMKKYYLMAGDAKCMDNLGYYYQHIEKDYEMMKLYYTMAIENNHINAMYNLGVYYQFTELNYVLMMPLYLKAIEHGHVKCMDNLGYYYQYNVKDYKLMKKYYSMAIKNGCDNANYNLGVYYKNKGKYEMMEKCHLMAINNDACLHSLEIYYNKNHIKLLDLYILHGDRQKIINQFNKIFSETKQINEEEFLNRLISFEIKPDDNLSLGLKLLLNALKQKIDLLELHFKYAPEGLGFIEAKEDFLTNIAEYK